MENQDDPKGEPNEHENDDSPSSSPPEATSERAKPRSSSKSNKAKRRAAERGSSDAKPSTAASGGVAPGVVIAGLLALAVGAAGGWFGHDAQAKAKLRADSAPATAGSAGATGPCNAWEKKICAATGDQSAACAQAKAALDLLTPSTCEVALAGVPATLAKVKAGRASCDTLTGRLCKDLPPGSAACKIVTERTPSFPAARCDEMLQHYDEVLKELQQIDQQQGQMGMPPGAAPMAAPPGMPGQ